MAIGCASESRRYNRQLAGFYKSHGLQVRARWIDGTNVNQSGRSLNLCFNIVPGETLWWAIQEPQARRQLGFQARRLKHKKVPQKIATRPEPCGSGRSIDGATINQRRCQSGY